jgi:AraC-like DNA-binding protein
MGEPFSRYLKRLRLEKAEQLLKKSPATLAQIAESIGFHDQFAFSHFFKKATGSSPTLFRERHGRRSLPDSR